MTVIPDPRQELPALEVMTNLRIAISNYLTLDKSAGPSKNSLAVQTVASMVHSLNLLGGKFWGRLHNNNITVSSSLDFIILQWYVFFIMMYHPPTFVLSLNLFPFSLFQNILGIL